MILFGDVVAPSGPAANLAVNLLSNLGSMLLMLALAVLGLQMWREHAHIRADQSVKHQAVAGRTGNG